MRIISVISAAATLSVSYSLAVASPHHARQDAPSTCGEPLITVLASYVNPAPFCSSYLGVSAVLNDTVTRYTATTIYANRTLTSVTGTEAITASSRPLDITSTGPPNTLARTVATSTLTFCNARVAKDKRDVAAKAVTSVTSTVPQYTPLPYFLQQYSPNEVSSACSCIVVPTPCVTITSVRTVYADHVYLTDVATTVTETPYYNRTVTLTPLSTTSVTVYATYIGAPNGTLAPSYLPSPTPIATGTTDDTIYSVSDLPFAISFYKISSSNWIGLTPDGGLGYQNEGLPVYNGTGPTKIPTTAILPFWDDLLIISGASLNPESNLTQRIVYSIQNSEPDRTITFEWVAGRIGDPIQHYRFWATFYESLPGRVTYTYWDISDEGTSATVGAQSLEDGLFTQYSLGGVNIPGVQQGLVLDYDIEANRFIPSTLFEGQC